MIHQENLTKNWIEQLSIKHRRADKILVEKVIRAVAELSYRANLSATPFDVLDDIFATSLSIATRGSNGGGNFDELKAGISRISSFIFSERYHLEKAITHATKAAYLATLIKYNVAAIKKFKSPEVMKGWVMDSGRLSRLNNLKKSNPEAFFYWYQMHLLTVGKT